MSQDWAPPQRQTKRTDWGKTAADAALAPTIPAWALEEPAADDLDDLFADDAAIVVPEAPVAPVVEELTDLDDLFGDEETVEVSEVAPVAEVAPLAEVAPFPVTGPVFHGLPAVAPELDDLFGTDDGSVAPAENAPDLDDLFGDDADLGADAPEAPATTSITPEEIIDLDDLFGDDDVVADVAPEGTLVENTALEGVAPEESANEGTASEEAVAQSDAPASDTAIEGAVEETPPVEVAPQEDEAPSILAGGWASPPAAVLQVNGLAPTRAAAEKRSLRRTTQTDSLASRDLPAVVKTVKDETAADSAPRAESVVVEPTDAAPVVPEPIAEPVAPASEAPLLAVETPFATPEASAPAPEETVLLQDTVAPDEVVPEESPAQEPLVAEVSLPVQSAVPEEAPVAKVEDAAPPAPVRQRESLEDRRRRIEEASSGNAEWRKKADLQAQMSQTYSLPDHLWTPVDRILGLISTDPLIQSVVNRFELTRDPILDAEQRRVLQEQVAPRLMDANVQFSNPMEIGTVFDMVYDELTGISVLGRLWRDTSVTEIMVDGWDKITIEQQGAIVRTPLHFRDLTHAQRVARDLAATVSDRSLSPVNPLVTAQLPGARITFVYGGIVKGGISISLRKFVDLLGMEKLLSFGALTPEMATFLHECVLSRATILVSGGTGTGKTTQINALSQFIPNSERVVTIEDAFELQLSNENVVPLQTKEKASADDTIIITQADLLVNALRMRPDRIIVGEIREGQGALVMLRAASTGHDGTMTTIHANTPEAALNERLADLVREASGMPDDVAKRSVAGAVHLVVQVTRKRGRRYISGISVVDRSCYKHGDIRPEPVFVGDLTPDGLPYFSHVGGVRPDTELGQKLAEAGFEASHWEPS